MEAFSVKTPNVDRMQYRTSKLVGKAQMPVDLR